MLSQILSQSTRFSSVNVLMWGMYVNAAIHTIVLPVRMGPERSLRDRSADTNPTMHSDTNRNAVPPLSDFYSCGSMSPN